MALAVWWAQARLQAVWWEAAAGIMLGNQQARVGSWQEPFSSSPSTPALQSTLWSQRSPGQAGEGLGTCRWSLCAQLLTPSPAWWLLGQCLLHPSSKGPGVTPLATIILPSSIHLLHLSFVSIPSLSPPQPPLQPMDVHFLASISTVQRPHWGGGGLGTAWTGVKPGERGPETITDASLSSFFCSLLPPRVHAHPHPTEAAGHAEEAQ